MATTTESKTESVTVMQSSPQIDDDAVEELLIEIETTCSSLRHRLPPAFIAPTDIEALRRKLDLLLYRVTPKPSVDLDVPARAAIAVHRCTICNTSALPLYNLAAGDSKGVGEHWRCVAHIPPDMLFPVGLWGEDLIASGRKPLPSRNER